jgi:Domain of unknown function (DUF4406)
MIRKVYIAGPMSGLPAFNYPAFFGLAKELRLMVLEPKVHLEVVSPAEFPDEHLGAILSSPDGDPSTLGALTGMTWGDYVSRALKVVADEPGLDAIITLPGWETSRGARIETFIGHVRGLKIVDYHRTYDGRLSLHEHPRSVLLRAWEGN